MLNLVGMYFLPVILLGGIALITIVTVWTILRIRKHGWPNRKSITMFVVSVLLFLLVWLSSLWLCFYFFAYG